MKPNRIAVANAGWKSQVIEMTQVVQSRRSGSAQLWGLGHMTHSGEEDATVLG
jgi:hypothetical protein